MKGRTDVKNKQPVVFVTALLNRLLSSCLSVAISPFNTLCCDDGAGTLHIPFCFAGDSGERVEQLRRKDAVLFVLPALLLWPGMASSFQEQLAVCQHSQTSCPLLASDPSAPG